MGGWGCPHDIKGRCDKLNNIPCQPGTKGCILFRRMHKKKPPKSPENSDNKKSDS